MWRFLSLCSYGLMAFVIAYYGGLFLVWCGDVTPANYDRIEKGMTKTEVVRILGRPAGPRSWSEGERAHVITGGGKEIWRKGDLVIHVYFTDRDRVVHNVMERRGD